MRPVDPGPSDDALIERARAGDDVAFRAIVERYESLVAATVIGMLGPGAEADDVGQETFIRFYKALDQFRGDAALSTYLTRIAMNLSYNALKRRQRFRLRFRSRDAEEHPVEPSVEGGGGVEQRELRTLIDHAMQQLSPDFRAVVTLRLVDGYSTRETAELLDIPLGTVLSRLSRAQRQLREVLAPHLDAS